MSIQDGRFTAALLQDHQRGFLAPISLYSIPPRSAERTDQAEGPMAALDTTWPDPPDCGLDGRT